MQNSENFEIFSIDNQSNNDWQKSIINCLEGPIGMTNQKIKYKALSYVIIGNELFKKTPEGILLKCLSESETYLVDFNVHIGSCGAHQIGHVMKWLLFQQGVYPTMLKDCIEFSKGCQDCQKHAGIQYVPTSELHSIVKPWPIGGLMLDLIGEIRHASSKIHRYILVGIYYFTKLVKVVPLAIVDQEVVINFIQSHVIYRFGISETLTTDQGSVFTG